MKKYFKKLTRAQWLSIIRHVLTFGGGLLIAAGLITEQVFMEISGALLSILGVIWGVSDKEPEAHGND